jgi:uncharacterized protein YegL
MEEYKNVGNFGFSAAKLDNLGSDEYTLVNIIVDASGSVSGFAKEMENSIKETIKACLLSPQSDSLMIRLGIFHDTFEEIHGFKLLENINLDDYNNVIQCGGYTLLYDSVINAVESTTKYAESLVKNNYKCNGITVVITDGDDNKSKAGQDTVAASIKTAITSESLTSLLTILVGVNVKDSRMSNYLTNFKTTAGFDQYIELDNADSKTLAKLAKFVSKSISAVSQSLKSGGPSIALTF